MAYGKRNTGKRKAAPGSAISPHRIIIPLAYAAAIILTMLRLPGMIILPAGLVTARLTARRPEYTGKDPWGRPAPGSPAQERDDRSYKRARTWFTHPGEWAAGPFILIAVGMGVTLGALMPTLPAGVTQCAGTTLWLSAWQVQQRRATHPAVPERVVQWASTQPKRMLAAGLAALAAATPMLILMENPWWTLGLPLVAAGWAGWAKGRKGMTAEAKTNREAWDLVDGWLASLNKPPVRPPSGARNAKHGATTLAATLTVRDDPGATAWCDGKTQKALTGPAQADGKRVAFLPVPDHPRDVLMTIVPDETPDWTSLDDTDLPRWLDWDMALTAVAWHSGIPRIRGLRKCSLDDSAPAWRFEIAPTDATSLATIDRDWLQGAPTDLGHRLGMLIVADEGSPVHWLLPPDWRKTVEFDDREGLRDTSQTLTRTSRTGQHIGIVLRSRADRDTWENALKHARLDPPIPKYDTERVEEGDGWRITVMRCNVGRASSVTDYLPVHVEAGFADAAVAVLLPVNTSGAWSDRTMLFTLGRRGTPIRLAELGPDGRASRILARALVSRALNDLLPRPVYVSAQVERLDAPDAPWAGWRFNCDLTAGATPADVAKALPRVKGALDAPFALVEWRGQSGFSLWAGSTPPLDPKDAAQWADPRRQAQAVRLTLDEAWAASGATGADGSAPTGRRVAPGRAGLVVADFSLPAGLSADGAMRRIDRFRAASGYAYVKQEDADDPTLMRLTVGHMDPLPRAANADWDLMAAVPPLRALPFGVRDNGEPAVFDTKTSPHILVTGTTGFGKSSAMQVIVTSASLKDWDVIVADPNKGAADFAPLRRRALAFATDLPHTEAALRWAAEEMRRRVAMAQAAGVGGVADLPEDARPKPVLVLVDEFNSLVGAPARAQANPTKDPTIANRNLLIGEENRSRRQIGQYVCDIAAQGRSAWIVLALAAQAFSGDELGSLPAPGTLKRNLSRLFLGNGNAAGNVSPLNVRDANRLIRSFGDMPKGRGVYEPTGGKVKAVQCWWSGGVDEMTARLAGLPDVKPLDLTGLLPPGPKLVGVVADETTPQVGETIGDEEDFEW